MKVWFRFLLLTVYVFLVQCKNDDPDLGLNHFEIAKEYGYEVEEHWVTTKDGYILKMFHMPPVAGSVRNGFYPILFQHALLDSSWSSVANPAPRSLAYYFVEQGFDLWFGNNRGNWYSINHTTLDTKSTEFWDFSYDEMALYDLPAEIEYVRAQTGAAKVNYIGHSEGTLQAFAGMSMNATTRGTINFAIMLGPVGYVANIDSHLVNIMMKFLHLDQVINLFDGGAFMTRTWLNTFGEKFCELLTGKPCDFFLQMVCGNSAQINETRIPVYIGQTPAGTSTKNMVHWGQGMRDKKFQMYDYGRKGNEARYGQKDPLQYDMSKVPNRIALLSGSTDKLADPKDVARLSDELPNVVFQKQYLDYAHLDFTWGYKADEELYPDMLLLLNQFGQEN